MSKTGKTHVFIFPEVGFYFLTLGGGFDDEEGATGATGASSSRGAGWRSGGGSRTRSGLLDFKLGRHVYVV
jgi:hypothetical protein